MSHDMKKSFIGTILSGLIEKTPDNKVMKAITKMVEDWVKLKVSGAAWAGAGLFVEFVYVCSWPFVFSCVCLLTELWSKKWKCRESVLILSEVECTWL